MLSGPKAEIVNARTSTPRHDLLLLAISMTNAFSSHEIPYFFSINTNYVMLDVESMYANELVVHTVRYRRASLLASFVFCRLLILSPNLAPVRAFEQRQNNEKSFLIGLIDLLFHDSQACKVHHSLDYESSCYAIFLHRSKS